MTYALVEGRFVLVENGGSKCPQSPSYSVGSTDTGYLSGGEDSSCSLAEALKDTSDFYFDMSDRWKQAFVTSLDDPIYPKLEPPKEEGSPRSLPPGLSLLGLFSRQQPSE